MKTSNGLKELVFGLCGALGVAGNEDSAADAAFAELSKYMPCRIDALGSVIGEKDGKGDGILLDAHIDQIGMIVTSVEDNGFVKVAPCGGVDKRVLPASEVTVLGRENVYGVFTSVPPHLSKDDKKGVKDFDDITVDTGLSSERAKELISQGDRVVINTKQRELLNGRIVSPSLDDRAGVAAILRCIQILDEKKYDGKIYVQFSVQEETGGGGAGAGAFVTDAPEAIAVDVSFAQAPGIDKEKTSPLGGGTLIGIAPSLDRGMFDKIKEIADKNNIPYNVEVMGGRTGTNSESIQASRCGKRVALLSIPQRNMHTGIEICDMQDIENTAKLLAEYIMSRGNVND